MFLFRQRDEREKARNYQIEFTRLLIDFESLKISYHLHLHTFPSFPFAAPFVSRMYFFTNFFPPKFLNFCYFKRILSLAFCSLLFK